MTNQLQRRPTIRRQLSVLVAACVLPVWLIAAVMARHAYVSKLDQVSGDLLENARAMTMAVDRELASVQASLSALGSSPSFKQRDFVALHQQSKDILKHYPGADIIVADITGQQLVNTYRPLGSKLPKRSNLDTVSRIFQDNKPVVSNLFYGAVTKRPVIAIDVPVVIDGVTAYDLSMSFPSEVFSSVLQNQNVFKDWYGTVVDGNGVITARTSNLDKFVGKKLTGDLRTALARSNEGTLLITTTKGGTTFSAFSKSSFSGWTVAVAVPADVALAQIYSWVGWAVGVGVAVSLLGILFASWLANRIAHDIQSLVQPALAIGSGEVAPAVATDSKETAELAEALVQASQLLQRRAAERDQAERQLSLTIVDLRRETEERSRAMEEVRRQEQLLIQQSRQAALGEMVGNIAHQWRQPLNALGLLVQQPLLFHELGQLDREFLEGHVAKSMAIVRHMSQTIDDFRNFFRPDKEKLRFKVADEVAKVLSLVDGSLQSLGVSLKVQQEGDPVIEGYPNEFAQVLLNILINARDVIAERAVAAPAVQVCIADHEGRAVLTVTDNAGGIPEEIMTRIFDPYFTTKGPQAGTGVGLFMSKTIIEKNMGGVLTACNVDGGAQFRIEV
ncbi:sensor histidine kinase [Geomonas agri]|uniref:sensor histidine kinase n=1 Tax=Geomonas agri TaxID=2873702 RepID=UPI001CD32242|nr:sensor histidine kinase [Geomonas agri]